MKHKLAILFLLPFVALGIERVELENMLATAATNQRSAYLLARNSILDLGTNTLFMLAKASSDEKLSWQQRLIARVCFERLTRDNEIRSLRENDWLSYPPYRTVGNETASNNLSVVERSATQHLHAIMWRPAQDMRMPVVQKCKELGLWYYYIELTWKQTGECAVFRQQKDKLFNAFWPQWCREALNDQPEADYLLPAMLEYLQYISTFRDRCDRELYGEILQSRDARAVPVLLSRYEDYFSQEVKGPEVYPGSHAVTYRGVFEPILLAADSRHTELLEKFIADHPALTDLKVKMAEVRVRHVPAIKSEPVFRLGTNAVIFAP